MRQIPNFRKHKHEFDPSTVGVLLTAHPRQQMFWDECLPSWTNSPYYVLMGYDDYNTDKIMSHMKRFPGVKDVFVTGTRIGHMCGELEQFRIGFQKLFDMGFHYILKLAADFKVRNIDGIKILWEALEKPVCTGMKEGPIGAQIIGKETAWMFGFAGILSAMVRDFDRHKKKGGSAELFCMRRRRLMNITCTGLSERIFDILDMTHIQGQYARDNKMTVQATWDLGEIWK